MIEAVLQAMEYRYACHQFEPDRSIPPADLDAILAAARLAPSSWGMEHWRFIVTEDAGRKLALQQACYNQPQLGSASVVITLVARVADLAPDTAFVQRQVAAQ